MFLKVWNSGPGGSGAGGEGSVRSVGVLGVGAGLGDGVGGGAGEGVASGPPGEGISVWTVTRYRRTGTQMSFSTAKQR